MNSGINLPVFLFLLIGYIVNLNGAIGCQSFEHTVDHWDVSVPVNQECACGCRQVDARKGYCYACGHYGDTQRGEKTARVLAQVNILLP
jgi:hypothetical protein